MQRPKGLLSKLLRCGCCGGGFSVVSATHVGCSNVRNKGDAVCTHRRTIKRELVEATVLAALRGHLMGPEIYAAFLCGFTAEWNAEQEGRTMAQEGQRDELTAAEVPALRLLPNLRELHCEPVAGLRGEFAGGGCRVVIGLGAGSSEAASRALASQSVVAGAGFEPAAFRL